MFLEEYQLPKTISYVDLIERAGKKCLWPDGEVFEPGRENIMLWLVVVVVVETLVTTCDSCWITIPTSPSHLFTSQQ